MALTRHETPWLGVHGDYPAAILTDYPPRFKHTFAGIDPTTAIPIVAAVRWRPPKLKPPHLWRRIKDD